MNGTHRVALTSLILISIIGLALFVGIDAHAQETPIEIGNNFDRELLQINPNGSANYKWTQQLGHERIINNYDEEGNPVYVDFITSEDENKIYFQSATNTIIFDKPTNTLETYPNGKLTNSQAEMKLSHSIKEAVNGTDVWNDILINNNPTTTFTTNESGIQFISTKGDFKTIYYINQIGFEYIYQYTNNDQSKSDHKYGFTTVCDGVGCDEIIIDNNIITIGESKNKSEIIDKPIKVGNKHFDLKNDQHDFAWALKHPQQNKLIIDFTHSKGRLNVGETLIVDPTFTDDSSTYDGYVTSTTQTGTACSVTGNTFASATPHWNPYLPASAGNSACQRGFGEWDLSAIPDNAIVTDTRLQFEITVSISPRNCDFTALTVQPSTATADQLWDEIVAGTVLISNDSACATVATNYDKDLGASGDSYFESQLSSDWGGIGFLFTNEVRDGTVHNVGIASVDDGGATPPPTLVIEYNLLPPDAPENLSCDAEPNGYNCSWTPINATYVTGYYIAHSPNNSTWSLFNVTGIGNVTSHLYEDSFGDGESNFIRVNATDGLNGTASNHIFQTTDVTPDAPSITASAVSETQIDFTRVAGASDGGDTIIEYDLRCELNNTGGWLSTVINGTIASPYNYSGLATGDDLTCQWRDRNGVGYSPYSSNATGTTFELTTGTVTHSSAVIVGNVALIEPTISITTGVPSPTVNQLQVYLNGSLARTETVSVVIASGASNQWTDLLFVELPTGSAYNATVIARVTNTTGTVNIESAGEIVSREYAPSDLLGDTVSLGYYNNTVDTTDPSNRVLKVNRPFDNATNTWALSCKSVTGFNEAGLTWYNESSVGFYKETLSASAGQNVYISCYNPESILFSTVSYGNLTGVLAGFSGFDDQLGSWFGLPMIFMFVFFIAGLFGGRQSGTSIVITLAVIAILGGIGLLVIDEALWGIMLVLGALGLFASRVRF